MQLKSARNTISCPFISKACEKKMLEDVMHRLAFTFPVRPCLIEKKITIIKSMGLILFKRCHNWPSLFSSLDSWGTPLISLMLTSSRPWCPGAWKYLFAMSIDEIILVLVETRTKMILSIHIHAPRDHHWPPLKQRWSDLFFSQEVVFRRIFSSFFVCFFFSEI